MGKIKPQALLQQSKRQRGPSRIGLCTIVTCSFVVIIIMSSLYSVYKHWYKRNQLVSSFQGSEDFEKVGEIRRSMKYELPTYAILNTSKGPITLELYKDAAREIVEQFLELCQKGQFEDTQFRHVVKNHFIQMGGSQKLGAAEVWLVERRSDKHVGMSQRHGGFVLVASHVNDGDKHIQFFITTAPMQDLYKKFTVFGRVIKGEDVVQEIEEVETDENYQPKLPVGINGVTLKEVR